MLAFVVGASIAGAFATTLLGSHGAQKWAGQWFFTHTSGPSTGMTGGLAFRHETDDYGAELLEQIGGVACAEPTDYFIGAYTVPDTEDLPPPPNNVYGDGRDNVRNIETVIATDHDDVTHASARHRSCTPWHPCERGRSRLGDDPRHRECH